MLKIFGDLLFPLIAQHELRQRLDPFALQCFAYAASDDAVSTMWPPGDNAPTFGYVDAEGSV